ncbi:CLUMA_CG010698, isoform A [Clunio marinus]|uniref:CLUMA_CG010698, isoform A n=1 Tax=Clunio marinus TaxID=568069 RepID=A0A1J1IAJ2_9DIPT|nr:CLUMA_CG010698, isoform A [Clunio marinus]
MYKVVTIFIIQRQKLERLTEENFAAYFRFISYFVSHNVMNIKDGCLSISWNISFDAMESKTFSLDFRGDG